MRARQLLRLSAAARGFVLLAIGVPLLWTRDTDALVSLLLIAVIWGLGQLAAWQPRIGSAFGMQKEAALTGLVCAFAVETSLAPLIALAVPPFIAALYGGFRGVAMALSAQLVTIVPVSVVFHDGLSLDESQAVFTWSITGLGLGLIAAFVRVTALQGPDELAPYLHAQNLIRQLIDLSGGLSSGLDVNTLGGSMLSIVGDELPVSASALYVPSGETLIPLITRSSESSMDLERCESLAVEAWAGTDVVIADNVFAFPVGDRAIIGGVLSDRVDVESIDLRGTIGMLTAKLQANAVRLDTALLFSDFRDTATADERRRLAREMHDGVAQDIASLGYLVDALAAKPASPQQAEQLQSLRSQITHVVAEVRQSVLTLRTSVGEAESLGAAIGSIARHLSEVSGIPIEVTLDEHTTRLRPEVEAELYRISQEAMNNAIKHARASTITVHCQVHAPGASITIADDGRGLQQARSDSHGLKIMRERARLVGATLTIDDNTGGGLAVTVQIPGEPARNGYPSQGPTERKSR